MPSPKPVPVDIPAGLLMNKGAIEAMGRYVRAQWVRFWQGKPQKIGGWVARTTEPTLGIPRAVLIWNDLFSRSLTAIGTSAKLYVVEHNATVPQDVTPIDTTLMLTNAFSTAAGSRIVTVSAPGHGKVVGQFFHIESGPTVGGLDMTGDWRVVAPVTANAFRFEHMAAATSTQSTTGNATLAFEYPPSSDIPTTGRGWGAGTWGVGTWGTPRESSRIFIEPRTWTLGNFGKLLLSSPSEGPLFVWDPSVIPFERATALAPMEAPGAMRSFFITSERFIIALGASADTDRLVDNMNLRWCAQGNPADWTPGLNKTAGSRRLTEGKKIIAGTPFSGRVSLIWTDTSLYTHTYTGSQFVFDTNPVASEAGLIGPHAFTRARGSVFWLGNKAFQFYSGGVNVIPNAGNVSDWVFERLRDNFGPKTVSFFVPEFNEVWWIMVPDTGTEPLIYAAVSLTDFEWTTGELARTAATSQGTGDYRPILASTDGYLYTHETGLDADGAMIEAYIEAGVMQLLEGDRTTEVTGFIPDFERIAGNIDLSVRAYDRPGDPAPVDQAESQIQYGDGLVDDIRVQGRLLAFSIRSAERGGDFRFGRHSFEVMQGGRRR